MKMKDVAILSVHGAYRALEAAASVTLKSERLR